MAALEAELGEAGDRWLPPDDVLVGIDEDIGGSIRVV